MRVEHRVVGLRVARRWGPARIACYLRHQHLAASTVHKILVRYHCPPLSWVDPMTGARLRREHPRPARYERGHPGDLVHVDIKKLGRIPDGGGWRVHGRAAAEKKPGKGYWHIHNAVDDYSRLGYSELLGAQTAQTAAGFWQRASAFSGAAGIHVAQVMTDNGSCYRSRLFGQALGGVVHKFTRPYRPQTNGKVERFNRTMLEEWAYARPYTSEEDRAVAFAGWLHYYNHHRAHTALQGHPPASRVPNLSGQYT